MNLGPVVKSADNALHQLSNCEMYYAILQIQICSGGSIIHPSNIQGLIDASNKP